jgi:hypothetical protein
VDDFSRTGSGKVKKIELLAQLLQDFKKGSWRLLGNSFGMHQVGDFRKADKEMSCTPGMEIGDEKLVEEGAQ